MKQQNIKDNITPEILFKKTVLSIFNDDKQSFNKISCVVKNKYMFWYNCGFASIDTIKIKCKEKFEIVNVDQNTFKIVGQPMTCLINVLEKFHTVDILFK